MHDLNPIPFDDRSTSITIRAPREFRRNLRIEALRRGKSLQQLVIEACLRLIPSLSFEIVTAETETPKPPRCLRPPRFAVSGTVGPRVVNSDSKRRYHLPDCKWAACFRRKSYERIYDSPAEARLSGKVPCGTCRPG